MTHFLVPLLETARPSGVVIERTASWLARDLEHAFESNTRKRGLLGRDHLEADRAMVIAPSQGVHTFGMRFPLDIVAVNRSGQVVKCRAHVPPRRVVLALRAFAFIELAAGTIERCGLRVGDRLTITAAGADE